MERLSLSLRVAPPIEQAKIILLIRRGRVEFIQQLVEVGTTHTESVSIQQVAKLQIGAGRLRRAMKNARDTRCVPPSTLRDYSWLARPHDLLTDESRLNEVVGLNRGVAIPSGINVRVHLAKVCAQF